MDIILSRTHSLMLLFFINVTKLTFCIVLLFHSIFLYTLSRKFMEKTREENLFERVLCSYTAILNVNRLNEIPLRNTYIMVCNDYIELVIIVHYHFMQHDLHVLRKTNSTTFTTIPWRLKSILEEICAHV